MVHDSNGPCLSINVEACFDLLYSSEPVRTLIFCNSKRAVDVLDASIYILQ